MRKLIVVSCVIACVSGCRVPAPVGVSAEEAQEAQDDINGAIGLLVAGAVIGLTGLMVDHRSASAPVDPEQEAEEARIKAELSTDRGRVRRATRLTRPKAAPRHKPLPAWF